MSANNINVVVVNGRLTQKPKLYEAGGEKVYALLRLAINYGSGEKKRTIYYDVKVWNGPARACAEHLQAGSLVSVQGRLDQFDHPETKKRWDFIAAEQVEVCARPKAAQDE
jgi:single-stranded DNA-binding protein